MKCHMCRKPEKDHKAGCPVRADALLRTIAMDDVMKAWRMEFYQEMTNAAWGITEARWASDDGKRQEAFDRMTVARNRYSRCMNALWHLVSGLR